MGRKIKFALEMQDGTKVRSSIEELREHFDLPSVMGYVASGKLVEWLEDRYYDDEAEKIAALDKSASDVGRKVCEILGVEYEEEENLNLEDMQRLNERKSILRQYTDNEDILSHIEQVAFNQEELADLLDDDSIRVIYLYGESFKIPLRKKNKKYIGINEPTISIKAKTNAELVENNIEFQNVKIPAILTKYAEKHGKDNNAELSAVDFWERLKQKYGEDEVKAEKFFIKNKFDEAGEIFLQQAEKNNLRSCYFLVEYYMNAYGKFPKDSDKELKLRTVCLKSDDPLVKVQGIYSLPQETGEQKYAMDKIKENLIKEAFQGDPFACREVLCLCYTKVYNLSDEVIQKCWEIGSKMNYGSVFYLRGYKLQNEDRDKEAIKYFQRASQLGSPEAQCNLAYLYKNGLGVEKSEENDKRALELLKSSAGKGYFEAIESLASLPEEEIDYQEALKWVRKGAEKNIAECQRMLGYAYYYGKGVLEDEGKAFAWFMKSAQQGDAEGQLRVGDCYYYGAGVEENDNEAFAWYMKSAQQGNDEGQYSVGECYYGGAGVEENDNEAFKWFMKSAQQGNAQGQFCVGDCYCTGNGVEEDANEAFLWYMKSAQQGYRNAQCRVGAAYYAGMAVENMVTGIKDDEKAYNWFLLAANNGNSDAMEYLGDMFYYGNGVDEDLSAAQDWYRKAVDNGNKNAQKKIDKIIEEENEKLQVMKDSLNELKKLRDDLDKTVQDTYDSHYDSKLTKMFKNLFN